MALVVEMPAGYLGGVSQRVWVPATTVQAAVSLVGPVGAAQAEARLAIRRRARRESWRRIRNLSESCDWRCFSPKVGSRSVS